MALSLRPTKQHRDWASLIREALNGMDADTLDSGEILSVNELIDGFDTEKVTTYRDSLNRTLKKFPALAESFTAAIADDDSDMSVHVVLVRK